MVDPMTTETAQMFLEQRDEAVAAHEADGKVWDAALREMSMRAVRAEREVSRLRLWIDSEGRHCPSTATVDAVLLTDGDC